ncbi:MAG: ABC transporter permease [Planctomycetota bacterium]
MHALIVVAKRELQSYFGSPLAYVFVFIFSLLACGGALLPQFELFGESFGGLLEQGECSLEVFFRNIPFLMAFFAPAIAMKLWADERKKGTIELLFTYPLSSVQIVLGKFVGAWCVLLFALMMTLPLVFFVNSIGTLDYKLVLMGYFSSALLAGAFTAIACASSALTSNNVISLIIGVFFCSALVGFNLIPFETGFLDRFFQTAGVLEHYSALVNGKVSFQNMSYFFSMMLGCFFLNLYFLETK